MSGWQLDAATGIVTFDTPPAMDVVVSAGFQFDVPVRFQQDSLGLTLSTFRAGEIPNISLIEVRL